MSAFERLAGVKHLRVRGIKPGSHSELACLHEAFESVLVLWIGWFIGFNTPSLHEDAFVLQQAT
jgi:hypothetical protein